MQIISSPAVPPPCEGARGRSETGKPKHLFDDHMENKIPIYNTADAFVYKYIKEARKQLIENPTEAETILWKHLKSCKTGYKIRRQHVIDKYVVDFVCLSHKLFIEIDGQIHLQQMEEDRLRTYDLNDKGFTVIRYTNEEVYENVALVVQKITEILNRLNKPTTT